MPIIKSAVKKVRKDKKKTVKNQKITRAYQKTLEKIKKTGPVKKLLSLFYSQVDRAAKAKTIHKNKAKRLKSQAARQKNK